MKIKIRIFSLLLCLCVIMLSFSSCASYFFAVQEISDALKNQGASLKDQIQTTPPDHNGNDGLEDGALSILERYEYTLTEADYDAFLDALSACEVLVMEGTDAAVIEAAEQAVEDLYYSISTQANFAYLAYATDVSNKALSEAYLFATGLSADAYAEYAAMCQRVYASESPYKDQFFADWSEEEISDILIYDATIAEYEKQSEAILVEYRELTEAEFDEETGRLFLELVECNNAIASLCGYDNYIEYAYEKGYGRDYLPTEAAVLREYVKQELLPLAIDFYELFSSLYEDMSVFDQHFVYTVMAGKYSDPATDLLTPYLASLPESASSAMRNLFEENNVIFADGENAKEGAFTGYLRAFGTPVCYFGPSYQDVYTVVHELGHYYSYLAQDGGELVLDLAELQSQGNEFLFTAFLAENQDPVYTAIVAYQLFNTVLSIVSCCIVDEFEQYVYTNEIIDPYTELDEIMQDICDSYDGGTLTDILDMESYWRHVVIESPVYYISYAVSGISALELYSYGVADFGVAAEMYVALIEGADHSKSYLEILEAAGLGSPFDASTYERIGALKAGW